MEDFNSADILEKQDRKKKLTLLEVGLFEVSFVLITIIVLFGFLNYFNILSLSTLYPNQLGFLPHQKIVQSKPINKTSINDIPLADITKKMGRFVQYPLHSGTGYVLSSQYPTIVAVKKDTKNKLLWVAASFYGKNLTSSTSTLTINDINLNIYSFEGLTIWYIIDNNTKIYKKTPEGSKPDLKYKTGTDYAANHITLGNTLFQIISQTNEGTKEKPELNMETLRLIKNSTGKENIKDNRVFTMYADQVFLP